MPFAVLAMIYAVSGTYVFSRATVREARASQASSLRDAAGVVANALIEHESALGGAARRIVFTEGVIDAIAGRDAATLRRLVPPLVASMGTSLVAVIDAQGRSILEVSGRAGAAPIVRAVRADRSRVAPVAATLRAGSRASDISIGIVEWSGPHLVVSAPVRAGQATAGVVVVAEALEPLLATHQRLTRTRLAILGVDGRRVVGAEIAGARPAADVAAQVRGTIDGRDASVLLVPMITKGSRSGTLVAATLSASGLGALGGDATKILLLALGALVGVFLVGSFIARWISTPVDQLVIATRALRSGDLSYRAHVIPGDEVGELARSFNDMAEELEISHRELEQRVEGRTRDLREALEELERANNAKSLFLAKVSHDLRSPLSSMMIGAELLSEPSRRLDPKQIRHLGDLVNNSGRHLVDLIDGLLDLGQIESGELVLRTKAMSVAGLVSEVGGAISLVAAKKGVLVDLPRGGNHRIVADPIRLRQVLTNLLTNAVKFTEPGGRVGLAIDATDDEVAIAVTDSGIGIAASDLERIFQPFEQASSGDGQGVGLGLAIARRIVDLHGGSLRATSELGEGSTFTVTLPRPPGETSDAPRPRRARTHARPRVESR